MEDESAGLSHLGRAFYETGREIIEKVCSSSEEIVSASCEVPEGFVRIPDAPLHTSKAEDQALSSSDKLRFALSSVLPLSLAALASELGASSAVLLLMTGVGGVISSFIQRAGYPAGLSDIDFREFELDKLTEKNVKLTLAVNDEKKHELIEKSNAELLSVCQEISAAERELRARHDIARDETFGKWVQSFIKYSWEHDNGREFARLVDALLSSVLPNMGIHVYDELILNEAGRPDIPIQEYLIDDRKGEEYSKVERPAVYSDKVVLARGVVS